MADVDDCIHGLGMVSACVLCNGRAARELAAERASMHHFVANYSGPCASCPSHFDQGDMIARTRDGLYVCSGCSGAGL